MQYELIGSRKTQTRSRKGAGSGAVLWRTCIYSNSECSVQGFHKSVFTAKLSYFWVFPALLEQLSERMFLSLRLTPGTRKDWESFFFFLVLFRSVSLFDTRTVALYLLPTWHWNKHFSLDKRTYHHALLVSGSTARHHFVWFVSCAEILKKLSCQESALFFLHTVSKKHFTFFADLMLFNIEILFLIWQIIQVADSAATINVLYQISGARFLYAQGRRTRKTLALKHSKRTGNIKCIKKTFKTK